MRRRLLKKDLQILERNASRVNIDYSTDFGRDSAVSAAGNSSSGRHKPFFYPLTLPIDVAVLARIINHVFCGGFVYLWYVDLDVFYDEVSIMHPGAGPLEPA